MPRYLLVLIVLAFAAPAQALRCGTQLVTEGDHVIDVLERCGEPAHKEEYVTDKTVLVQHHHLLPLRHVIRTVNVKKWTYNFGSHKFMRMIQFEDGIVTDIETLDRGF